MTDYQLFGRQVAEYRKRANRKSLPYVLLVMIPAWILGVVATIVIFPIYLLWMVFSATWFAIHHINRPEELFRNMRNAEF